MKRGEWAGKRIGWRDIETCRWVDVGCSVLVCLGSASGVGGPVVGFTGPNPLTDVVLPEKIVHCDPPHD